ncbi:MAG: glycosyl hydrolase-related protein [Treponema sp.]|jgi:alpha-mannosidase|nr:glycosyl hydrolase-related protein [Treponema sp.]
MLIPKVEHRINQYLRFLKDLRYREIAILNFEALATEETFRSPSALPERPWEKVSNPWGYGKPWTCYWFRSSFVIPPRTGEDYPLYLRIRPNADSLLFLDGKPAGAFNPVHKKVKVPQNMADGGTHELYLEAYSGHPYPGCHPFEEKKVLLTLQHQIAGYPCAFQGGALVERVEPVYSLYYDAACLFDLAKILPGNSLRKARVLKGLYDALMGIHYDSPSAGGKILEQEAAQAARQIAALLQAVNGSTAPQIHLIGHAHIDHAWLWHIGETERKVARTYINMARLAEEYPGFVFIQTQPAQLEIIKNEYPDIFAAVKKAYQAGNWEPNGGMWVEADCNLSGGESLIRQFLVGKRANREMLGHEADTLWLPDVFGYAAALPQILAGCGIKYFVTSKINWNDTTRFPYDTFIWRGIDGTGIKTHYISSRMRGYNGKVGPEFLAEIWDQIQHKEIQSQAINAVGEGDGGGGTARGDLEMAKRLGNLEGAPKAKWNKVSAALDSIFGPDGETEWPQWRGELYLELHRGTYTTQARTKRYNRRMEFALRHTEAFRAIAAMEGWAEYPHGELLKNWKTLLTNQFHDIIPGSSINRVYREAEAAYRQIEESLDGIVRPLRQRVHKAFRSTELGAGAETALTLFNDLSWEREGPVFVPASVLGPKVSGLRPAGKAQCYEEFHQTSAEAAQADGHLSVQCFENIDGEETAVFFPKLPAMGWTHFVNGKNPGVPLFEYGGHTLDTPFYYIQFDEAGAIRGIRDKQQSRELVQQNGRFNYFVSAQDVPILWEAWDIDADWTRYLERETRLQSTDIVTLGSECCILRRTYRIGRASTLVQDMITYDKSRRIDFVTKVDWHEKRRLLKVCFDSAIDSTQVRCEVQYGHLLRNTHQNLPQDRAMFEVCAHKWVSLEEAGSGIALLNDCKYGHDINGNRIRLTLLRSPTAPDEEADQGIQRFTYSLLPFEGSFAESAVIRTAYELNAPVAWEGACRNPGSPESPENPAAPAAASVPASVPAAPASGPAEAEAAMGADFSLLALDNPAIILESLKAPELPFCQKDGGDERPALILRLYESTGAHTKAKLCFAPGYEEEGHLYQAWEMDMLEQPKRSLNYVKDTLYLEFRPFEIKTIRVEFGGAA